MMRLCDSVHREDISLMAAIKAEDTAIIVDMEQNRIHRYRLSIII